MRGFTDQGAAGADVVKGTPARWFGPRSQRAPRDDGRIRLSARERLRLGAFPPRLLSIFRDVATGDAIFLDLPESAGVFSVFVGSPGISNSQRRPISNANWIGTVHGLPISLLTPRPVGPSYLAFLGRISPEKAVDRAIRIAERCGLPIKIAAKIDAADQDYFDETIRPLLKPNVDFIGAITDAQKSDFLSGALALLRANRLAGALWPGQSGDCVQPRFRAGSD